MKRRRAELGLSQRQAADRANVSPTTWGSLETHAQPVNAITAAGISRALRWTTDSVDRILAGGDPVETNGPDPDEVMSFSRAEVDAFADRLHAVEATVVGLRTAVDELKNAMSEVRSVLEDAEQAQPAQRPRR